MAKIITAPMISEAKPKRADDPLPRERPVKDSKAVMISMYSEG